MRNTFLSGGLLLILLLLSFISPAQIPLRNPRPAATIGPTTPSATRPADYPLASAPRYAASGYPGTYRLPDGSWHPAEIFGPDLPDRVRLRPDNLTDYAVFWPGEVSAYVVRGDTFVTVPAFVQRKGHRLVPASFAQRQYRDDRYEVLKYQAFTPEDQRPYRQPAPLNGPAVPTPGATPPIDYLARQDEAVKNSFFGIIMDLFVYPRTSQTILLRQAARTFELPAKAGAYRRLMLGLLADDPILCARLRAGEMDSRFEAPQLLATYAANRREALLQARK
ncbi:hypothetical protein [Hymenobacter siberiensis]|jgi:hypothetical protein|uniref:hypothetical protein n=1 Tax=Hymenobacter siberiensis TaxID=2848396 RepID=UPI001C1E3F82|nr:hypothetical protein [Hymenobacter siberiensis]MBU6123066.1 hypothetical protein [Hymenobacter siberiensis]